MTGTQEFVVCLVGIFFVSVTATAIVKAIAEARVKVAEASTRAYTETARIAHGHAPAPDYVPGTWTSGPKDEE